MKRYLIHTAVQNAQGGQTWYVDADTPEDALEKYRQGDGDLYASDVEVTSVGEPELEGETTLDDFGDFGEAPQRKPLTGVEIMREWNGANNSVVDFARAIEAAHGIKAQLEPIASRMSEVKADHPSAKTFTDLYESVNKLTDAQQ